ncbi:MAG: hypothetical protein Q7R92_03200, partial [bacterium]|nr:hypothetical protein [bacterium]
MGGANFKKFIFFTVVVAATFGISLAMQYAAAVWTAPSGNPPACVSGDPGCDAPLNISNTAQQKQGMLLLNYGNSANGLIVQYGNVGIGTTSPTSLLQVSGALPKFYLSDTAGALDNKHWFMENNAGVL